MVATPSNNKHTALKFLTALYGANPRGYQVLWTRQDRRSLWLPAHEQERLAQQAVRLAEKQDVYFGIGLHPEALGESKRGTADGVICIPGFWADFDVQGPAHKMDDLPPTLEDAVELSRAFGLPPTVLIDSGHGLQAWWLFPELWQFAGGEERERAQEHSRRFHASLQTLAQERGWRIDNTSDLARVLRLPGTFNRKLEPVPVRIIALDERCRYSPSDFEPYLVKTIDAPRNVHASASVPAAGESIPDGARNNTLTSRAGTMRRRGMSESEIVAALLVENGERCEPPLPEDEVRRIAASISRYPPSAMPNSRASDGASPTPPTTLEQVIETYQRHLHLPDPEPLYAVLGTVAANRMAGDPVWLMLVGASGAGKTELLQPLAHLPGVHLAATITVPGLLSGTRAAELDQSATGGLLPSMGGSGLLILKDFTSILSMHPAQRTELLAAFREIYDGHWTRHLGVDRGKKLEWKGKLGLIAGCTEAIDSHHTVMASMGERFCMYRMPPTNAEAQARRALAGTGSEGTMRAELADAVRELFDRIKLASAPAGLSASDQTRLVALATLAARCRSAVERDPYTREIVQVYQPESPARLVKVLARLLAGMLAVGVEPDAAWTTLTKTGLDCMPTLRRLAFDWLIARSDPATTDAVATALSYPQVTMRRTLQDLAAHGVLIEYKSGKAGKPSEWSVSNEARELYATATAAGA